jgi:hypothetical protein
MSYILGSTVPLLFTVTNEAGEPENAATNELTIGLPDGTEINPGMTNTDVGVYTFDYVPTVPGRYTVYAVTTGPAASFADVFDVRTTAPRYMISLSAAKKALNMRSTSTADDNELLGHIEAATDALELYLHETVVRRTVVEVHQIPRPVTTLALNAYPVVSVTSIDGDATWDDLSVDTTVGVVTSLGTLFSGTVTVTYIAGRSDVPAHYARAAELVVASLWQSQRIPVAGPRAAEEQLDMDRYGVVIPPRARELLGGTAPMVGG